MNTSTADRTSINGGINNTASAFSASIGGGVGNTASGIYSLVGGGAVNSAAGFYSTILGGRRNSVSVLDAVIGGGRCNLVEGDGGGGGIFSGRFNRVSGSVSVVAGGVSNIVSVNGAQSFIGGGNGNMASCYFTSIIGGINNTVSCYYATVGGGCLNTASSCFSAILGGKSNNTSTFSDAMIIGSCLTATQACTTFVNCLSANNLTQNCFVRVGANKVLENSPFSPSTKSVGSFLDTTTQSATLINSPTKMTLNTTDISNNISVVGGTAITVTNAGVYNLQFSAQLYRDAGGTSKTIDIWLRKNGVDVPYSTTTMVFGNNTTYQVAAWNFVVDLSAGGNVELIYSVEDLDIELLAEPQNLAVPHPSVPSLIVTMTEI
jgi:hypothetical protein